MIHLTAADVLKQQNMRLVRRREAFNVILETCYKRIQKCIQVTRNAYSCFCEVPEFLIGYPLYELNECLQYCIDMMTAKGFAVKYIFPRVLLVSWLPPKQAALPAPKQAGRRKTIAPTVKKQPQIQSQQDHHSPFTNPDTGEKKVFMQKTRMQNGANGKKYLLDLS